MAETLNGTPAGQAERIARVIAQVGFPVVVACVLMYAILAEFVPGQRRLTTAIEEQTRTLIDLGRMTREQRGYSAQNNAMLQALLAQRGLRMPSVRRGGGEEE